MVHKHRNAHKATIAKDLSPMRNMSYNKYALSSSPSGGFGLRSHLTTTVALTSNSLGVNADNKWQYNNMINNNREQFNNMHFC